MMMMRGKKSIYTSLHISILKCWLMVFFFCASPPGIYILISRKTGRVLPSPHAADSGVWGLGYLLAQIPTVSSSSSPEVCSNYCILQHPIQMNTITTETPSKLFSFFFLSLPLSFFFFSYPQHVLFPASGCIYCIWYSIVHSFMRATLNCRQDKKKKKKKKRAASGSIVKLDCELLQHLFAQFRIEWSLPGTYLLIPFLCARSPNGCNFYIIIWLKIFFFFFYFPLHVSDWGSSPALSLVGDHRNIQRLHPRFNSATFVGGGGALGSVRLPTVPTANHFGWDYLP